MLVGKRNIFLVGPMGAGKSTIGRQLAQQLNMDFFDSDKEIETRTGANISWVFDVEGETGFRNREEKIINELTQKQGIVLATGGGSIKSSVTRNHLLTRGLVVYLEITITKQLIRTQRDKKRPLLNPPKSLEKRNIREWLEILSKERTPLYEEVADIKISSDEPNSRIVVNKIITFYNENIVTHT